MEASRAWKVLVSWNLLEEGQWCHSSSITETSSSGRGISLLVTLISGGEVIEELSTVVRGPRRGLPLHLPPSKKRDGDLVL
jgi:hypothetical protein